MLHPSYSSVTFDCNLALLTLDQPFKRNSKASVIRLASTDPFPVSKVTISGWGQNAASNESNVFPNQLMEANDLKVLSRVECQELWDTVNIITPRMWCAQSPKQSACAGDIGGPVVQFGLLVGVVSWGPNNCLDNTLPNVYTSVASLKENWIENYAF